MSVTLTDAQYAGVKDTAAWYRDADAARHHFAREAYGASTLKAGQAFTFCGFAGSGKSTCLPALIEEMRIEPENVGFMAPTGKAAKVVTGKLQAEDIDRAAATIHSTIYTPKRAKADAIQNKITKLEEHLEWREQEKFNDEYCDRLPEDNPGHGLTRQGILDRLETLDEELEAAIQEINMDDGPSFNLKHPSEIDPDIKLFLVDEASMCSEDIVADLASFGRPILAVGDPGQLPPPKGKWGFEMQNPDVFLTEIHRQAADNPIIHLATLARQGEELEIGDYGNGVRVVNRRNDDVTLDMDREAMILCGVHKTRWRLTKQIRQALGIVSAKGELMGPMVDEPLMVTRNSQKIPELVNGSILRCLEDHGPLQNGNDRIELSMVDDDTGVEYEVEAAQAIFEEHAFRQQNSYSAPAKKAFAAKKQCEQVDWGHVLTVHKSQGSEWDNVVVHDESGFFRADADRWLYTGITRAAKELTVVVT